jgi:colanic acid biosynthesis glycosyl transferase WcaI
MKILLFNNCFPPMANSAANLFHELAKYFIAHGHDVGVVTELPWRRKSTNDDLGDANHLDIIDNINVIRVKGFPFSEGSIFARGINAALVPISFYRGGKSFPDPDVILVYSPPLTLGVAAYLSRVPFVFNAQDIYPQTPIDLGLMKNKLLIKFSEFLERFIYKKAAAITVHSSGNRDYLINERNIPPDKVMVVHNWIDTDLISPKVDGNKFRTELGLNSKFIVGYAGTMGYAQDLNPILQSANILKDLDDILFLLIGDGIHEKKWRSQIQSFDLKNVRFLSLQPAQRYPEIVSSFDVGLVPLTDKLTTPVVPGKLKDFMSCGKPVIATVNLNGDTAKLVCESGCGHAISQNDPQKVADKILNLKQNPTECKKMGENGRAYAVKHFSLEKCGQEYLDIFQIIVNNS